MNRRRSLERIRNRSEPWDIIVIGGGATGAGCALDAASRGLDVLLLEQHDLGKGTSSRSTKLIHGGVRYLKQGNISLVREALKERGILLRNAPHVVHEYEFLIPCYSHWQKALYGIGMRIYDLLAGKLRMGRSRTLSPEETLRRLPGIKPSGLRGSVSYFDGQFDDTRLLIDILRTADSQGACVLNYSPVISFLKDRAGKVNGVEFEDIEGGDKFTVEARSVINATGVFCDAVRKLADESLGTSVTFAQGVHIVLERRFLPSSAAMMIPKTSDGRVLFCIPWHDHTLVGTTDTPVESAELEPKALDAEVDYILRTVAEYLTEKPLRSDILSVWAGIRPLIKKERVRNTAKLSRSHDLFVDEGGLITITGGKWTTFRKMAEDAVDKAAGTALVEARKCVTKDLPILAPFSEPGGELLHPGLPYTRADIIRAVSDEMARTVEDVLTRRTRALFLNAEAAVRMSRLVAEIMAAELGRSEDWIDAQVSAFAELASSYRADAPE